MQPAIIKSFYLYYTFAIDLIDCDLLRTNNAWKCFTMTIFPSCLAASIRDLKSRQFLLCFHICVVSFVFNFITNHARKKVLEEKLFQKLYKARVCHQQVIFESFTSVLFTFQHSLTLNIFVEFPRGACEVSNKLEMGTCFITSFDTHFLPFFSFQKKLPPTKRRARIIPRWKLFNCEILWIKATQSEWKLVEIVANNWVKVNNVRFSIKPY